VRANALICDVFMSVVFLPNACSSHHEKEEKYIRQILVK
jgi:hypothetical protein